MARPNKNKTGKMMYVPKIVIEHIDDITKEESVTKADAYRKMIKNATLGKEIQRINKDIDNLMKLKKRKRGIL